MKFKILVHPYMATPKHKNPVPGVMKFTILVDPSLVIITIYFCLINAWKKRRRFLKNCSNFTLFTSKLPPLWMGVMKFIISLSYRCYTPNLLKIAPVVLDKKMLTHDGRRTTDDDGRQPIAKGHLSDSGHLKNTKLLFVITRGPQT